MGRQMIPNRDSARLVLGLGCSTSADAREIIALIATSLAEAHCDVSDVAIFATHVRKRSSLALAEAANFYDVPLLFLDDDALNIEFPGTCEAVAAAAGPLVLGKRKSRFATCAIARCRPDFDLSGFGQPTSPSALIAASTLATSLAGP